MKGFLIAAVIVAVLAVIVIVAESARPGNCGSSGIRSTYTSSGHLYVVCGDGRVFRP